MVTMDDEIDKFVTAIYGANYGRALAQRISIPVGVVMHLKELCFKFDYRNKCNVLPDSSMLSDIDISQLFFFEEHL